MNKHQYRLFFALAVPLLTICCAASAQAQRPRGQESRTPRPEEQQRPTGGVELFDRNLAQPFNSVRVLIRYRKQLGYKSPSTYGQPGPTSCRAFSVALAKPAKPVKPDLLIPVNWDEKMTEDDDYYFCYFLVSELALNQEVTITASVNDNEPWIGGSQSKVPSGWRRVISDGTRSVSLTSSEPRARMNFEMVYEPSKDFMQPSRRSDSNIFKKP